MRVRTLAARHRFSTPLHLFLGFCADQRTIGVSNHRALMLPAPAFGKLFSYFSPTQHFDGL
jgi:hypothetical protein